LLDESAETENCEIEEQPAEDEAMQVGMPNEYSASGASESEGSSDGSGDNDEKDEEILPEIRESLEERVQEVLGNMSEEENDEDEPIVQVSSSQTRSRNYQKSPAKQGQSPK